MPREVVPLSEIYEVRSILGKMIRTTKVYFERIRTVKHPELNDKVEEVLRAFEDPDEIWHGEQDIFLYYRRLNRHWLAAVARHLNGDGFLITAYRTNKKKRKGTQIWPKKR